jgi:hypothetical protein
MRSFRMIVEMQIREMKDEERCTRAATLRERDY